MANEQNLKPFKKGEDERRNLEGRPKKYVTLLKEHGYKRVKKTHQLSPVGFTNHNPLFFVGANISK